MNMNEKVVYTACQGWGCHEHCILATYVVDGKIERTERSILKGSQAERYGICQKGILSAKFPYLPERLLYPMKRVGERGEGKFERISWEQALDEIGAKLNEIRKKYGSRAVVVNPFPCGYPINTTGLGMPLQYAFISKFDASMLEAQAIDMSIINMNPIDYGDPILWFMQNVEYLSKSDNLIILWGGNPIGWTRPAGTSRVLMDAKERGVKLVDIGVIYDSTAAKVDQFIPIRPGTDGAMALAMTNMLIEEGLYDEPFLIEHTVAPFLVREDNGLFLRESDIVAGGDSANYMFWNRVPAKAMSIAPHSFDFGDAYPDLCADVVLNGIHCKTAFFKLKEHVSQWTPESQEAITGVPAETVRKLLYEYVDKKPSTIFINYGLRYLNGTATARSISLLPVLSGNLGLPGGRFISGPLGDGYPITLNMNDIMYPDGIENAKGDVVLMNEVLDSFDNRDSQQFKAFINTMSNPVQNWPNRSLWRDQVFPNMDLVVVFEVRMTDTCVFADYLLPEATIFEREEIVCPIGNCIVLNEPAIEALGESRPPADIWRMLAERVGLGQYFDHTTEEWLRIMLQTDDPGVTGVEPPITLERLREEKIIRLNVPDDVYDNWENMDLITPSGRVEFYCEDLADASGAMGNYVEPQIHNKVKSAKYPLQLLPGRHRFYMQGQLVELPELRTLGGKVSVVALNPVDAQARSISQGDWVEVFNDRGNVRARAHLSEAFPSGMAHLWYSYQRKDYPTDPPTALSSSLSTREVEDAVSIKWGEVFKQRFGGLPLSMMTSMVGRTGNETLWDDLCEVRKVEEMAK
jgi:anaerobic selenocysteine-containing dehydrogenase